MVNVSSTYRSHCDGGGVGCGAVEMATFSNCYMKQLATRGYMSDPIAAPCVCW